MFRKKFYYGVGTDHIVKLTQVQADSINNLRIRMVEEREDGMVEEREDGMYAEVTFVGPGNVKAYSEAAEFLNEYLKTHSVDYTEEDEAAGLPILRPVK